METPITLGDDLAEAADRIEAQEKEIEKLRGQVPRWIPVEERLPENFRKVLCWGEYFRVIYDTPHDLGEFERPYECNECDEKWASECNTCYEKNKIKRPPQSWCYVEAMKNG